MNKLNSSSWTRYLVAASGTAALAATSASAAIVYHNPADQTAGQGQSFSFDIVSGAVTPSGATNATSFRVNNRSGSDYVEIFGTTLQTTSFAVGTGGYVLGQLSFGTSISGLSTFATTSKPEFDYFSSGAYPWEAGSGTSTGYVGLRFLISGQTHYAWAQFFYNDGANQITLLDFAYETTPDTAILAGATTTAIPEPASAALLLSLAAGSVATYRRRRA